MCQLLFHLAHLLRYASAFGLANTYLPKEVIIIAPFPLSGTKAGRPPVYSRDYRAVFRDYLTFARAPL